MTECAGRDGVGLTHPVTRSLGDVAWELFRREGAHGPEMVGIDGDLVAAAPLVDLPVACEITVEAPSASPDFLGPTEATIEAITAQSGGRIVATRRTLTRLSILVHLRDDGLASRFMHVPLPARASVSVAPSIDPGWTVFDRFRPVGMEEQSLFDLATMADLHRSGDIGGVRPIEHVVTHLAPARDADFATAMVSLGLAVEASSDAVIVRHDADPADITSDSWTIRQIAERCGADYDGWRCAVVTAARPSGRMRRR